MAHIYANPSYTDPLTPYAEGGGAFNVGDTATLEAHATTGYFFSHWADVAGHLFYDNPLNVKVHDCDETYTANFTSEAEQNPEDEGDDPIGETPRYTVTVACEFPGEGIVTGGGVYDQGEVCTITATENPNSPNHKFVGWRNLDWDNPNGKVLKTSVHSFEVFDDESWVAIFDDLGPDEYPEWTDEDEDEYESSKKTSRQTINVYVEPAPIPDYSADNGTAEGGGTFYSGETCTLTATANTSTCPDNHFICWKRTQGSLHKDTALEIRTENPYSFQVYPPDQHWWAIFGTGLTRVTVSTNLPVSEDGKQGGLVWLYGVDEGYYSYTADVLTRGWPPSGSSPKVYAATLLRDEVWSYLAIKFEVWFMKPQQNGDIGIWMPKYIMERKTRKRWNYPFGDANAFVSGAYHYGGRVYFSNKTFYLQEEFENAAVVDLYVHFVQVGFILRNSAGNILRNVRLILRANG